METPPSDSWQDKGPAQTIITSSRIYVVRDRAKMWTQQSNPDLLLSVSGFLHVYIKIIKNQSY